MTTIINNHFEINVCAMNIPLFMRFKAKRILAKYGFTRSVSHFGQLLTVVLIVGSCALLAWVLGVWWNELNELAQKHTDSGKKDIFSIDWTKATSKGWNSLTSFNWSSAISLGVAIVVYQQWRLARYEISIDKYYDRLDTANKRLELLKSAVDDRYNMLVFAELDKLEYVMYKYDFGFMSPILAARAVDNFKRWCSVKEHWEITTETTPNTGEYKFRKWAVDWVNAAGYDPKTRIIVDKITKQCELEG